MAKILLFTKIYDTEELTMREIEERVFLSGIKKHKILAISAENHIFAERIDTSHPNLDSERPPTDYNQ